MKANKNLIILNIAIALSFCFIFKIFLPVNYNNLGGEHSWLSGSTIKFVNQWLEEGAFTHRFTCYESFDSIEFHSLEERTPYVSYPTGNIFIIYLFVKAFGYNRINISFLKHYQMVWYLLTAMLFGTFMYIWIKKFLKGTPIVQFAVALLSSVIWILLPPNVYYLANIYYNDQAIIFWSVALLLLEYISESTCSSHAKRAYNILKCVVIYIGVLIDYYFWILIFIVFLSKIIQLFLQKTSLSKIVKESLLYVLPVFCGVVTFVYQLTYTKDWFSLLIDRFLSRTGSMENVYLQILQNIRNAYFSGSDKRMILYLSVFLLCILFNCIYAIKKKIIRNLFSDITYRIVFIGFLAPFVQILFLKNHSAIHDFSTLKLGWVMVISGIIIVKTIQIVLCSVIKSSKPIYVIVTYLFGFVFIVWTAGIPVMSKGYGYSKEKACDYVLEEEIYKFADYNDVFFSLSMEIPINPPQHLAVSEKQVYQISSLSEMLTYFPDLDSQADLYLVIMNHDVTLGEEIWVTLDEMLLTEPNIYQDDTYTIIPLDRSSPYLAE